MFRHPNNIHSAYYFSFSTEFDLDIVFLGINCKNYIYFTLVIITILPSKLLRKFNSSFFLTIFEIYVSMTTITKRFLFWSAAATERVMFRWCTFPKMNVLSNQFHSSSDNIRSISRNSDHWISFCLLPDCHPGNPWLESHQFMRWRAQLLWKNFNRFGPHHYSYAVSRWFFCHWPLACLCLG